MVPTIVRGAKWAREKVTPAAMKEAQEAYRAAVNRARIVHQEALDHIWCAYLDEIARAQRAYQEAMNQ